MLSVLLLSCRRLDYLKRTVVAIRQHFELVEPEIEIQTICFDNGSDTRDHASLAAMGFDVLFLSRENLGIGPAMNRLVSTVRTPYLLNLQDDWLIENPDRISFAAKCISILEADANLGQVKLDTCHFLDFKDRAVYDGPFQAGADGPPYFVQNPEMLWGGFTFPPAITRTRALFELGPYREDQPFRRGWAESEYSARSSRRYRVVKSPRMLLFRHIGEEASTGWGKRNGSQLEELAPIEPKPLTDRIE